MPLFFHLGYVKTTTNEYGRVAFVKSKQIQSTIIPLITHLDFYNKGTEWDFSQEFKLNFLDIDEIPFESDSIVLCWLKLFAKVPFKSRVCWRKKENFATQFLSDHNVLSKCNSDKKMSDTHTNLLSTTFIFLVISILAFICVKLILGHSWNRIQSKIKGLLKALNLWGQNVGHRMPKVKIIFPRKLQLF